MKKLWKTVKIEQKFSKKPCFLKLFRMLFNLGLILVLLHTKAVFSLVFWIFLTPLTPLDVSERFAKVVSILRLSRLACKDWFSLEMGPSAFRNLSFDFPSSSLFHDHHQTFYLTLSADRHSIQFLLWFSTKELLKSFISLCATFWGE